MAADIAKRVAIFVAVLVGLCLFYMNPVAFARTAAIAKQFKVIAKAPSAGTYRTDLAKAANSMLRKQGVNTTGLTWKATVVKVTPGGK